MDRMVRGSRGPVTDCTVAGARTMVSWIGRHIASGLYGLGATCRTRSRLSWFVGAFVGVPSTDRAPRPSTETPATAIGCRGDLWRCHCRAARTSRPSGSRWRPVRRESSLEAPDSHRSDSWSGSCDPLRSRTAGSARSTGTGWAHSQQCIHEAKPSMERTGRGHHELCPRLMTRARQCRR
jgi:hypothetical protein